MAHLLVADHEFTSFDLFQGYYVSCYIYTIAEEKSDPVVRLLWAGSQQRHSNASGLRRPTRAVRSVAWPSAVAGGKW